MGRLAGDFSSQVNGTNVTDTQDDEGAQLLIALDLECFNSRGPVSGDRGRHRFALPQNPAGPARAVTHREGEEDPESELYGMPSIGLP